MATLNLEESIKIAHDTSDGLALELERLLLTLTLQPQDKDINKDDPTLTQVSLFINQLLKDGPGKIESNLLSHDTNKDSNMTSALQKRIHTLKKELRSQVMAIPSSMQNLYLQYLLMLFKKLETSKNDEIVDDIEAFCEKLKHCKGNFGVLDDLFSDPKKEIEFLQKNMILLYQTYQLANLMTQLDNLVKIVGIAGLHDAAEMHTSLRNLIDHATDQLQMNLSTLNRLMTDIHQTPISPLLSHIQLQGEELITHINSNLKAQLDRISDPDIVKKEFMKGYTAIDPDKWSWS